VRVTSRPNRLQLRLRLYGRAVDEIRQLRAPCRSSSLRLKIGHQAIYVLGGQFALERRHDPFALLDGLRCFLGRDLRLCSANDSVKVGWPKRRGISRLLVMAADALGVEYGLALLGFGAGGRLLRHRSPAHPSREDAGNGEQQSKGTGNEPGRGGFLKAVTQMQLLLIADSAPVLMTPLQSLFNLQFILTELWAISAHSL
jgi:hypothetical protein